MPRDQNEEADALTNGDFSAFTAEWRVDVDLKELNFLVLPQLAQLAEGLYPEMLGRRGSRRAREAPRGKLASPKERDPWA